MDQKQTIIISGGLGGVGRAVAKQFAENGWDTILLYLTTPEAEAAAFLRTLSRGNHEAIRLDIRDSRATGNTIEKISLVRGNIHAAVHAAVDPIVRKNLIEIDDDTLKGQFDTGVFGGFNFLKLIAQVMQKQKRGGALVGILSRPLIAQMPHPRMGGYIVAKYALWGLLKELSLELAPLHIRVNAIAPDFLDTKLNADIPEGVRTFISKRVVLGSIRSPEDVARATLFLCSEEGRSIIGKFFSLDEREVSDL